MLQRIIDNTVAGEWVVEEWVVGVKRFPFGLDVRSINANDRVQRRPGNLIIPLLCVAPSERHCVPKRSHSAISPMTVDLEERRTYQVVRRVRR